MNDRVGSDQQTHLKTRPQLPVVFVHGVHGKTTDWEPLLLRLARGRPLFNPHYAGDSDAFQDLSIPAHSIFNFGLYREQQQSPHYYRDIRPEWPSIGGCPIPRDDENADRYTLSFAKQLERSIENICRATGVEQVDLCGFSMGGVVARAYTRWRSLNGPEGASRIRRLLIVGSPNLGINSLEASILGYASVLARLDIHAMHGEAAELNDSCRYWQGDSYINHLNEGWDDFCQETGIEYANTYSFGASIYGHPFFLKMFHSQEFWLKRISKKTLLHENPNFDYQSAMEEAAGDSDYVVRVASASLTKELFPNCHFNQAFEGVHDGWLNTLFPTEHRLHRAFYTETVIRRFLLQGLEALGMTVHSANLSVIQREGERPALLLETELEGEGLLTARVVLAPQIFANDPKALVEQGLHRLKSFGVLLHPGTQRTLIRVPKISGKMTLTGQIFALGEAAYDLGHQRFEIKSGRPFPGLIEVDLKVRRNSQGHLEMNPGIHQSAEMCWALDGGAGVQWSRWTRAGLEFLPSLPNGSSWELIVRARQTIGLFEGLEAPRPFAARLNIGHDGEVELKTEL
jgi:pimeloyl-ACP methyl ester carboxylesterase